MIKQILIKCTHLVNRDDIMSALKNASTINDISNTSIQNDIIRLISYYNFVVDSIFENYIKLEESETLYSDENNRIYFSNLKYKPVKINNVLNSSNSNTIYSIHTNFISTNASNSEYKIIYNYAPNNIKDINESINIPVFFNEKIVCYGVVSEFLASKDQYEKSEFWKNKFLYELFKFKTKKERRLKPTFYRWNLQ